MTLGTLTAVGTDRQCTATKHGTENRCKSAAIKGGTVCVYHGGKAPQVRAAANRRLLELVDPALSEMSKILDDKSVPPAVKVTAIKDVLDRAGLAGIQRLEISTDVTEVLQRAEALEAMATKQKAALN